MEYRFCPLCAAPLAPRPKGGRTRPTCPKCDFVRYENPVVGVAGIHLISPEEASSWTESLPKELRSRDPGLPLILLGKRRIPPEGWCIPCGYVEADEEVRQALVREMKEETGLEVEPGEVFAVESNFHDPDQPTVGIWFRVRVLGGALRPGDDVGRLGFFPADSPPELAFPTDRVVLGRLAGGEGS